MFRGRVRVGTPSALSVRPVRRGARPMNRWTEVKRVYVARQEKHHLALRFVWWTRYRDGPKKKKSNGKKTTRQVIRGQGRRERY